MIAISQLRVAAAVAAATLAAVSLLVVSCGDRGARSASSGPVAPAAPAGKRAILYYRNPMGLKDTSPVPKKDAMGMDYAPVYGDEVATPGQVHISAERLQTLGVRTVNASPRDLARTLHIVGTVRADERSEWTVAPKFEGWIDLLAVGTTGAKVRRGQVLAEVYAPDLIATAEDFRTASVALAALGDADPAAQDRARALAAASLTRLRNWGIGEDEIVQLKGDRASRRTIALRAYRDGIVLEKPARAGARFMPGDVLFQLADLSHLWIVGNVFEQDLAAVRSGARATVTVATYPGERFPATVTFVSPVVQSESRTAEVRIEIQNRDGRLKPGMYGTIDLDAPRAVAVLAVPDSAIIDSGTRQIVLVARGGGAFEAREVGLGVRGDGYTEVRTGLSAGEPVVTDGNFLIDAESNLKSAITGLGAVPPPGTPGPHGGH